MQPPAQELVARDLHDTLWTFRHIYRGRYRFWVSFTILFTLDIKERIGTYREALSDMMNRSIDNKNCGEDNTCA